MVRLISKFSFVFLIFIVGALIPTHTARAANVPCIASPNAGPPGTSFSLTATGFTPNTFLWLYATEPDGSAFSDPTNQAFGGAVKSDENGTASFLFVTRFEEVGKVVARAIGAWTLVVQELGPGNVVVHEAHCAVSITNSNDVLVGATLTVEPSLGFSDDAFAVSGTNFAANEIVNLWLTPPANCSGFGYVLGGLIFTSSAANAIEWSSVKTNSSGSFTTEIFANTPTFCTGTWYVSARAPGSGRGGIAAFQVVGHPINLGSASLSVYPASAVSRGGTLTFIGAGFSPNEVIICWYTRPEGNVREFPAFKADSSGGFSFVLTTGFDDDALGMHYSEGSLGTYTMSCQGQSSKQIAIAAFSLYGGLSDP